MRVLVTGPTGFVGRAAMARLGRDGHEVIPGGRRDIGNLGPDANMVDRLAGVEAIVHLAARAHVMRETYPEPNEDYDWVNAEGTFKLAEDATAAGVRRFVYLSTAKVMGPVGRAKPFTETDAPDPADAYAASKLRAELHLAEVAFLTGLEVVVLRAPLVYGPGVKGNFLSLMHHALSRRPLPLASIANRRSLISLDNLTDALAVAVTHPAAAGLTAFVSDGEDVSTPALIRRIATAAGRTPKLVALPPWLLRGGARLTGKGAVADRLLGSYAVSNAKFRSATGWDPPQSLDGGLAETVSWFLSTQAND